jgi:hypothetical protein
MGSASIGVEKPGCEVARQRSIDNPQQRPYMSQNAKNVPWTRVKSVVLPEAYDRKIAVLSQKRQPTRATNEFSSGTSTSHYMLICSSKMLCLLLVCSNLPYTYTHRRQPTPPSPPSRDNTRPQTPNSRPQTSPS